MDDLKRWLQDGGTDYDAGVTLYVKHGRDKALHALFTREQVSDYKKAKLKEVLKSIYHDHKDPTSQVAILHKQIQLAPVAHKGWPDGQMDPVLQSLHDGWKPMYGQLMNLTARIYDIALQGEAGDTNKRLEACQLAHQVLDLDDRLDDIYFDRDHFMAHGRLPAPDPDGQAPVVGDPVRMATELKNIERYIREYKKLLRDHPGHKLAAKRQQNLQDYEKQQAIYRKHLKLDL